MLEALPVLITIGAAGGLVVALWRGYQTQWEKVAQRLGMTVKSSLLALPKIVGNHGIFQVTVVKEDKRYRVTVDSPGYLPYDLELSPENLLARMLAPDILTGDSFFDHNTRVTGTPLVALALLDHETRSFVFRDVVRRNVLVRNGTVIARKATLRDVERSLPGLIELAKRLVLRDEEIPARLAANAASDPLPAVQIKILRLLYKHYRSQETTAETARKLVDSPHAELRLEAAMCLMDEGLDRVCQLVLSDDLDDEHRLRAARHLARSLWAETAIPVLEQLLRSDSKPLRRAAIEALGLYRHKPAVAAFESMARSADPITARGIAEAIGRIGDGTGEPCLIGLLRNVDVEVRIAAARALGRVGTTDAVEALLSLADSAIPSPMKAAARDAIARIQSRLPDAEKGQLSIASVAEHEGALSAVCDDPRGALSIEGDAAEPRDEAS